MARLFLNSTCHLYLLFNNLPLILKTRCSESKGHVVSAVRISPTSERLEKINNVQLVKNVKQMRQLIRFSTVYRIFVDRCAYFLVPLNELLSKGQWWKRIPRRCIYSHKRSICGSCKTHGPRQRIF